MKLLITSLLLSAPAWAQDARDAEIFGSAPASTKAASAAAAPTPATTSDAAIDSKLTDHLQVGGRLELRATASKVEGTDTGKGPLTQLKQADLFFDARPNDGVRAFLRARFTEQTGTIGVTQDIDELWIKTDWQRQAFFTTGKQHVKWGSGRLWNPTDFTAKQSKNPFDLFDRRLGQTMIKVHIPDEKHAFNYYAVLLLDDAEHSDRIGGALRGEFAFLGTGELALSVAAQRAEPTRFGVDVSSAIGPVDAFIEAAASRRQTRTFYRGSLDAQTGQLPTAYSDEDKTFLQVATGINKTWKYFDDDNITLGAEYFDNGLGYSDRTLGIYSLVTGQSPSLYVGRRYVGAYLNVPSPGSWNDTSIYLNSLRNLSDKSTQARLTTTWTIHKEATLEAFVSRCFGDYGELCFRVPDGYQELAAAPTFTPEQKIAIVNLPTKRSLFTAGAGFSMNF